MLRGPDDALLLHPPDTGGRTTMKTIETFANLHKYQRPVGSAHD